MTDRSGLRRTALEVIPVQVEPARVAEWPDALLDVAALMREGWRPVPFRQFILKVHSRCNLACSYCYVYRSPDQSWKAQPVRMGHTTVIRVAERIAEHAVAHSLSHVAVVLHGGEPLLAGPGFLTSVAEELRAHLPAGVGLDLTVHTNATLLDDVTLEVLLRYRIRVGASLDGTPGVNDARRLDNSGRGTHSAAVEGLRRLTAPRYRHLFAGLLCVVDPASDPVATYEHLLELEPPVVDFLLPHANWSNPPARPGGSVVPYGDWLIAAFDRWYGAPEPEMSVRLFDDIMRGMVGRPSRGEAVGLSPAPNIVVEADGSIEHLDVLKSAYDGAARTGLHVATDSFDAVLADPRTAARQIGAAALADTCRRCEIHEVCGGGYYPHRYRAGAGFRNPSVYCDDLQTLIWHIHSRLLADLARLRSGA